MTDDTNLDWYLRLRLDDRVDLMRDPHAGLPPHLINQVIENPGVYTSYWPAEQSSNGRWALIPTAARKLAAAADQLDWWWNSLDDADRAYLVEHRNDELPARFGPIVSSANGTPPNPDFVFAIMRDAETGAFRLPNFVDVFIELKARDHRG